MINPYTTTPYGSGGGGGGSGGVPTADWPLEGGGPATLLAYNGFDFTNELVIAGNTATLDYVDTTVFGSGKFGRVTSNSDQQGFWYQFVESPASAAANWVYIGADIVGSGSNPADGSMFLSWSSVGKLALYEWVGGSSTLVTQIDAAFEPSTDPADNCVVWVGYDGATGDLTIRTAAEEYTSNEPQLAGLETLVIFGLGVAGTGLEGTFSQTQLGTSVDAIVGYTEWLSPDPGLPEGVAPKTLLVVTEATPTEYNGNFYGSGGGTYTSQTVSRYGWLMPDGVTVIPLPDTVVSREELALAIADFLSTQPGQELTLVQQSAAQANLVPRLTSAEIDALTIGDYPDGFQIYDTDLNVDIHKVGSAWVAKYKFIAAKGKPNDTVTGTVGAETLMRSVSIAGAAKYAGPNGRIIVNARWDLTNNANAKTPRVRFGSAADLTGTTYYTAPSTSTGGLSLEVPIRCDNSMSAQWGGIASLASGAGPGLTVSSSVDLTTTPIVVFSSQPVGAGDVVTLLSYVVWIEPGV